MMDEVEFVTTAPAAVEVPSAPGRAAWSPAELASTLVDASSHVRFLLKELSGGGDVPTAELKSRPVAYAQVQRICSSRGKEPLVLATLRGATKCYRLHPNYVASIPELVADASAPPPSVPKPPGERKPRQSRRALQGSALDGIADSRGSSLPAAGAPPPVRRVTQGAGARSLAIPGEIAIEFCKELLSFVNGTANGTRYRILLEDDGYRLEAC